MVRDNRSQKNKQVWLRLFYIMLINNKKSVHNFSSADLFEGDDFKL